MGKIYIQDLYDLENRPQDIVIEAEDELDEDDKGPTVLKSKKVKVVIAPAHRAGDPGSIPGPGENFSLKLLIYDLSKGYSKAKISS